MDGSITARGGQGGVATGSSSSDGGDGSPGRILLEDPDGALAGAGSIDPSADLGSPWIDIGEGFRTSTTLSETVRAHFATLLGSGEVLLGSGYTTLEWDRSSIGMIFETTLETITPTAKRSALRSRA